MLDERRPPRKAALWWRERRAIWGRLGSHGRHEDLSLGRGRRFPRRAGAARRRARPGGRPVRLRGRRAGRRQEPDGRGLPAQARGAVRTDIGLPALQSLLRGLDAAERRDPELRRRQGLRARQAPDGQRLGEELLPAPGRLRRGRADHAGLGHAGGAARVPAAGRRLASPGRGGDHRPPRLRPRDLPDQPAPAGSRRRGARGQAPRHRSGRLEGLDLGRHPPRRGHGGRQRQAHRRRGRGRARLLLPRRDAPQLGGRLRRLRGGLPPRARDRGARRRSRPAGIRADVGWIALNVGYQGGRFEEAEQLYNRAEPLVQKSLLVDGPPAVPGLSGQHRARARAPDGRAAAGRGSGAAARPARDPGWERTLRARACPRVAGPDTARPQAARRGGAERVAVARHRPEAGAGRRFPRLVDRRVPRVAGPDPRRAEALRRRAQAVRGCARAPAAPLRRLGQGRRLLPGPGRAVARRGQHACGAPGLQEGGGDLRRGPAGARSRVRPQWLVPYMDALFEAAAADPPSARRSMPRPSPPPSCRGRTTRRAPSPTWRPGSTPPTPRCAPSRASTRRRSAGATPRGASWRS